MGSAFGVRLDVVERETRRDSHAIGARDIDAHSEKRRQRDPDRKREPCQVPHEFRHDEPARRRRASTKSVGRR
jgi:hypothetical protein